MPLYTHLRAGEVSLFSVWFLSYNAGLQRDCLRFLDIYSRLDMMPAGVAAGAGSSLNLDRNYLASLLNFSSFMINPTDAVGTRDFILEFIFCCLSILLNLSRLSEELIIFSSPNFNFFELPQRYCSGSSIMPHKINPDLLELTRARCSLISGYFSSLATILKGLPSSYQRDLQEDKRCLFPTVTITKETLEIFPNFLDELRINQRALEEASKEFSLYSTELVNYLVKKGLTQRRAHFIVGNLIKEMKKKNLKKFTLPLLKTISNLFKRDVLELLKYQNVIEKKGLREVVEKQLVSSAAFISSLEGWLKRN
jgi:argininosuccinate lyase